MQDRFNITLDFTQPNMMAIDFSINSRYMTAPVLIGHQTKDLIVVNKVFDWGVILDAICKVIEGYEELTSEKAIFLNSVDLEIETLGLTLKDLGEGYKNYITVMGKGVIESKIETLKYKCSKNKLKLKINGKAVL